MPRRYVSGRGLLMSQKAAFLSVRLGRSSSRSCSARASNRWAASEVAACDTKSRSASRRTQGAPGCEPWAAGSSAACSSIDVEACASASCASPWDGFAHRRALRRGFFAEHSSPARSSGQPRAQTDLNRECLGPVVFPGPKPVRPRGDRWLPGPGRMPTGRQAAIATSRCGPAPNALLATR